MLQQKRTFSANGSEGMLDVILGCTLIFLLLTALVKIEASHSREIALPEMELSEAAKKAADGATESKKTVISIKEEQGEPRLWLDDREISQADLQAELEKLGPATVVALRRDRNLSCGAEDAVILACQEAGIQRIAIMLKEEN